MQKAGSRIEKAQNKSLWSQTIHNSSLWNTKRLQNEDLTLEIMSSDSLDPRRPCHRLRVNLKICLLQTDCCRIEKVSYLFRAKPAQATRLRNILFVLLTCFHVLKWKTRLSFSKFHSRCLFSSQNILVLLLNLFFWYSRSLFFFLHMNK